MLSSTTISCTLMKKTTTKIKPLYTTNLLNSKKTLSFPIINTFSNIPDYPGKGPPEFPFKPQTEPAPFPKENPVFPTREPEFDPSVPPEIVIEPSKVNPFIDPNPNPKPDGPKPPLSPPGQDWPVPKPDVVPPQPPDVVPPRPPGPEIVPPPVITPPPPTVILSISDLLYKC